MRTKDSAASILRSATAPYHERVDRLFTHADLGDRAAYGRFLTAQAEAHIAVEDALTRGGAAAVLPDWPERQRAGLLRADLTALGLPIPAAAELAPFASPAASLGAVYVLEGSRLGGRLLQRSVPPELPSSFLGASDPAGWRRLLLLLDERLANEDERQVAIRAAAEVFMLFERSGRQMVPE